MREFSRQGLLGAGGLGTRMLEGFSDDSNVSLFTKQKQGWHLQARRQPCFFVWIKKRWRISQSATAIIHLKITIMKTQVLTTIENQNYNNNTI